MFALDSLVEVDNSLRDRFQPISTEEEFAMYTYPAGEEGKITKEAPTDLYNHGMDALRVSLIHISVAPYVAEWLAAHGANGRKAFIAFPGVLIVGNECLSAL